MSRFTANWRGISQNLGDEARLIGREKLQFDGKAIEGLRELVEHHAHQQERCQQAASDAAESH
jgi:hypothetical protein